MVHHRHRDDQQIEGRVTTGTSGTDSVDAMPTRRRAVIATAAVAVVVGAGFVWAAIKEDGPSDRASTGADSPEDASSARPSTAAVPSGSATPAPGPAETPDSDLPVQRDPVPLDETAEFGDAVSAELIDLTATQAEGQSPGEISGPAIRVTVQLINGTSQALSLDAVTVFLYFGSELTPAPQISDDEDVVFRGSLAPGKSAQGVYTFSVAEDERDNVSVTVSHSPTSAIVVFTGDFS